MKKQIILVTGATSAEGKGVVDALLAENKFAVRILTRHPGAAGAEELKARGVEIAVGDFNDKKSLLLAMAGCYGVYGTVGSPVEYEKKYRQATHLIDAVKESGIRHFISHVLPDFDRLSDEKFSEPDFDIPVNLKHYIRKQHISASFIEIDFYYENFLSLISLQPSEDGSFSFWFPQGDAKLALASVEDIGGVAGAMFDHPIEYIGRTVAVVGADEQCAEYARVMGKVLNRNIQYRYTSLHRYAGFGFQGSGALSNLFESRRAYTSSHLIDLIESYGLNPKMQSFEQWLEKNKEKFQRYFDVLELKESRAA